MQFWQTSRKKFDKNLSIFHSSSTEDKKNMQIYQKKPLSSECSNGNVDSSFHKPAEIFCQKVDIFPLNLLKWQKIYNISNKRFHHKTVPMDI